MFKPLKHPNVKILGGLPVPKRPIGAPTGFEPVFQP